MNDRPWERDVVEGPFMIDGRGRYYLFHSANRWDTADYAVGYAVCDSPTGPCRKPEHGPWLTGDRCTAGPGGQEVLVTRRLGVPLLTYHAWAGGTVGYDQGGTRSLHAGRLDLTDDGPVLASLGPAGLEASP